MKCTLLFTICEWFTSDSWIKSKCLVSWFTGLPLWFLLIHVAFISHFFSYSPLVLCSRHSNNFWYSGTAKSHDNPIRQEQASFDASAFFSSCSGTLHMLYNLIFITALRGNYGYPHNVDEKSEF